MPGTHPARAGGEEQGGETPAQAVPGTCSGLAFPGHSFLPVLCLSRVTQGRLRAGFFLVGHEPNLWITVKLQCLLCKIVVMFRSD